MKISLVSIGTILLLLVLSPFSGAQNVPGTRKDDIVVGSNGPVSNPTIWVCLNTATGIPCSPLAQIFSDPGLTQPLTNPFTGDGLGNYHVYAAPGRYQIQISGTGIQGTSVFPDVVFPNDPLNPIFISGAITTTLNFTNLAATPTTNPPLGTVFVYTKSDKNIYILNDAGVETELSGGGGGGGGSGSVTSVGLSVPPSSIFVSSNPPVTTSGNLAFTVNGSSGGIPYFNTASSLQSSTTLSSGFLIAGGGLGSAPVTSSVFDDGTNPTKVSNGITVVNKGLYKQMPNAGTGTTVNLLVCENASGQAATCPTSTISGITGTAGQGSGITGNVQVCIIGRCPVVFDNQTAILHWAIPSTTTPGNLHDTGSASTTPGVENFLIDSINSGAGTTAQIDLGSPDAIFGSLGLTGTGTTNALPKFVSASQIGNSLWTDNGTTATYFGTGGISIPQAIFTGGGPFAIAGIEGPLGSCPAISGTSDILCFTSNSHALFLSNGGNVYLQVAQLPIVLSSQVSGFLSHANIASTAVTPGSYTNSNITVAADGSITAASSGSGAITFQNGGSSLGPATIFNCSTNTTCSLIGSTLTITASATGATAFSALTASVNSNSGTFSVSGNNWDFSAATSLKAPVGAGFVPTASGSYGYDSTANKWVFGQNGATVSFGLASSACGANSFVSTPASATAAASCTQPSFSNLSGTASLTSQVTGLLPHANIALTAVTPGSYTNANITVAADGSITAAANGSGGSSAWSAITGAATNTNTGFVLAPSATGIVPWTINCPSGITVDCFDVELNGTKEWWIDSTGNMNFAGTQMDLGSSTSTVAGVFNVHGIQTTSGPGGCIDLLNDADAIPTFLCAGATAGQFMVSGGLPSGDIVQFYSLSSPTVTAKTANYTVNCQLDFNRLINYTTASSTLTLPQAGGGSSLQTAAGCGPGFLVHVSNSSATSETVSTTTSNFYGSGLSAATSFTLAAGQNADIDADTGFNYHVVLSGAGNVGTVTGVTATAPILSSGGTAPVISATLVGTDAGLATAATISTTAGQPVLSDANGGITTSAPDLTASGSIWYPFGIYSPLTGATASNLSVGTINAPTLYRTFIPVVAKATTVSIDVAVSAASQHGDVGMYSISGTTATLIWHSGSFLTTSTGTQSFTLGSPVTIAPGNYYVATCSDSVTPSIAPSFNSLTAVNSLLGSAAVAHTHGQDTTDLCTAGVLPGTLTTTNITNSGSNTLNGALILVNN